MQLLTWWNRQNLVVKLLSGLLVFVLVCCACSIPLAIIAPDRTPTPQQAVQDSATPIPAPDTPAPTDAPAPTNTSLPELAFAEIVQHPDEKGWNSTQYNTYFDTIKGKQISGSGTVLEIEEYGGRPYVSLDMKPGEPEIDAYLYINKDDVLRVGLGQNMTFAGTIDSNWSEDNGFYALQIENVTLVDLGEIPPTATPAPSPTPTITPIPTLDIGNDIQAQVMCKDFVRDNLKSPSSADFGGLLDDWDEALFLEAEKASEFGVDTTNLRNTGIWVVTGQVDAQNSFGAMIRSRYTCVMDYEKGTQTWYLLDISIE